MQCPVCEAENQDDAIACAACGREMAPDPGPGGEIPLLDGLEMTRLVDSDLPVRVEPVPGVERTQIESDPDAPTQWTAGPIALERTRHEPAAGATPAWTSDLEVDLAREPATGQRTPAPAESATCPWCGATSLGAVCDSCGRRKSRYAAQPARQAAVKGETVTCPACFARVARDVRCSDCGMPFPLQEL